ncbi:MAG: hypothetical protein IAX22_03250 [Candidatus Bathyarchaeota archaeon]|nr:hypothetical protein [Candidatus Bathyarchaeota archaeon]
MKNGKASKFNIKIIAIIVIIIIAVSSVVTAQYILSKSNIELPEMTLTVIGSNGEQKTLNKQDILALEAFTAKGGLKTSGGIISGVGTYTGVIITDLLNLVGGISSEQNLKVVTSDGYPMTYTYNQVVNGKDFTTYNPETGNPADSTQPLKLVITYALNGEAIRTDAGPLRIGILGSEGWITEGNLWAKRVIQLEVINPEPTPSTTPTPTASPTSNPTIQPTSSPTATPNPTPTPWTVVIKGTNEVIMAQTTFESLVTQNPATFTETTTWRGTALYQIAVWAQNNGVIDGSELELGYVLKVIGSDGQSATFNNSRITNNQNIIVANTENDLALTETSFPLRLTGSELVGYEKIKAIEQIEILPIQEFTLTVVNSEGENVILFSNDLAKMTSITYDGGSKKSTGTISNVGNYTGVKLIDICNLIGITSSNSVTVKASDGYTTTYTYDQVANGVGFTTYDSLGEIATPTNPVYLIVAYWYNGVNFAPNTGPLKTIVVGIDGLITDSNIAAKQVVEIEIT